MGRLPGGAFLGGGKSRMRSRRRRDPPLRDQDVDARGIRRHRTQHRHHLAVLGHLQRLALLHAIEIDAQVLAQLADADQSLGRAGAVGAGGRDGAVVAGFTARAAARSARSPGLSRAWPFRESSCDAAM